KVMLEDQISVVGRMQAADVLDYWQHRISPSPVVMDWLKRCVNIGSKACSESVQFIGRATGMEEPELAVPGSKSGLVSKLLVRAQAL
ncbi:41272_t:CDS:2, partial [Gigaspora margarita]